MTAIGYGIAAVLVGAGLLFTNVPAFVALSLGIALALVSGRVAPSGVRAWTPRVLQAGVVALGAGMNLPRVLTVGAHGFVLTAFSLALTMSFTLLLGRWWKVERDTSLLLGVGTAICGGSAIAAVASVLRPKPHEVTVSLAVVFVLNAVALVLFPPLGHALGMSEQAFGTWAALAIHDTSSVVGAGLAYGPQALDVATTTKLARALWIVPLTLGIAAWRTRGTGQGLSGVRWPWFIVAFLAAAALFGSLPALTPLQAPVVALGRRLLVLALFFVGLGLSRSALRQLDWRPLAQGVVTWVAVLVTAALWVL